MKLKLTFPIPLAFPFDPSPNAIDREREYEKSIWEEKEGSPKIWSMTPASKTQSESNCEARTIWD